MRDVPVQGGAPGQTRRIPIRALRPPLVVRVWPDRRWEIVPLGVARFPEEAW